MKFFMFIAVVAAAMFFTGTNAYASAAETEIETRVYIDGEPLAFRGQGPVVIDDRLMVPVRDVFEALDFEVHWDENLNLASIFRGGFSAGIYLDRDTMPMAGGRFEGVGFTVPPQIINGRLMAELSAVLNAARVGTEWDTEQNTLNITTAAPIRPELTNVHVDVLDFIRGIYQITIRPRDFTIDPRSEPHFRLVSEEGTIEEVPGAYEGSRAFVFSANPGTGGRNVSLFVTLSDKWGARMQREVILKGNDWEEIAWSN